MNEPILSVLEEGREASGDVPRRKRGFNFSECSLIAYLSGSAAMKKITLGDYVSSTNPRTSGSLNRNNQRNE